MAAQATDSPHFTLGKVGGEFTVREMTTVNLSLL